MAIDPACHGPRALLGPIACSSDQSDHDLMASAKRKAQETEYESNQWG